MSKLSFDPEETTRWEETHPRVVSPEQWQRFEGYAAEIFAAFGGKRGQLVVLIADRDAEREYGHDAQLEFPRFHFNPFSTPAAPVNRPYRSAPGTPGQGGNSTEAGRSARSATKTAWWG